MNYIHTTIDRYNRITKSAVHIELLFYLLPRYTYIGAMSTDLKLYTYPNNTRAYKALIAAQYVHVDVELPEFEFGKTNKTAEFLMLNPSGM